MRNTGDVFIKMMADMLNPDLIKSIITIINIDIIKKQKRLKRQLMLDIKKLFNIYYYDNNFLMYLNENNQIVLQNIGINSQYNNISLYNTTNPNTENQIVPYNPNNQTLIINNQDAVNTETVILDNFQTPITYPQQNDNVEHQQRNIKIYIYYI